ncbi:MAG: methyltransferase domain-containing protein [Deltaproteobacteria bacterium]|nr:methyltransferase domain-containing protein [Deltaproteobacteria bacterium]
MTNTITRRANKNMAHKINLFKHHHSLTDFYLSYIDNLYQNPIIQKQILDYSSFLKYSSMLSERELFKKILIHYLEEAELTLSLIKYLNFKKNDLLLEIGGGLGFVYGFLKKQGFNVYGIEPSDLGFDGYFNAAIQIFKIIDVDKSNFYPFPAKECVKINKQFDIIFSNNVLEHIPELEKSFFAMKHILKSNGVMVHNTVNYFVPYEAHLKILLVPFFPKLTEFFKPSLKKSSLWNGLRFITSNQLKNICKSENLHITFRKDTLQKTFLRLDSDPEFATRQKYFIYIHRILKLTRLIRILDKIPIALTTPIEFTIRKNSLWYEKRPAGAGGLTG